MTPPPGDALARLLAARRGGRALLLLFDYDGTLAPLVPHPRLAVLPPATRRLLDRLSRRPGVRVGIISGRMLDELRQVVGLPALYLGGTSGLEIDLHGVRITDPRARRAAAAVARCAASLQRALAGYAGAWLENKRLALAVHYRAVEPQRIRELRERVREALQPHLGELRMVEGPMAVEVMPSSAWSKGTVVEKILAHLGADRALPLYAGDAANDADALHAVAALGGIPIGVGPDAPAGVPYRLPDPAALAGFLFSLDAALSAEENSCCAGDGSPSPDQAGSVAGKAAASLRNHGEHP